MIKYEYLYTSKDGTLECINCVDAKIIIIYNEDKIWDNFKKMRI